MRLTIRRRIRGVEIELSDDRFEDIEKAYANMMMTMDRLGRADDELYPNDGKKSYMAYTIEQAEAFYKANINHRKGCEGIVSIVNRINTYLSKNGHSEVRVVGDLVHLMQTHDENWFYRISGIGVMTMLRIRNLLSMMKLDKPKRYETAE